MTGYAIQGGADASQFAIVASTGALTFVSPPNFEAPSDADTDNGYEVAVRVQSPPRGAFGSAAGLLSLEASSDRAVSSATSCGALAVQDVSGTMTAAAISTIRFICRPPAQIPGSIP